ncbi:MAG: phage tail tip lysozyme [Anaerosacchariphilus sp.]
MKSYTAAVDSGKISCEEFLHPLPGKQYGYGLAQWTSPGRKAGLWNLAKQKGVSIADEDMQIEYLLKELQESYGSVLKVLNTTTSIREASDIVLKKFEIPANTGESVCTGRAARGHRFNDSYVKGANDMTVQQRIEKAISWMEDTANDDSHGYCQDHRWGSDGDNDRSSAVITAWENAGVPVKTKGATYTGNMLGVFTANGFEVVTHDVNLKTRAGLERGDVLLNTAHHTAMYCGNGKEVEASINEKGTAHSGKPGDQTGKEFLIRDYRNYPWTHVLRYAGTTTTANITTGGKYMFSVGNVKSGTKGNDVKLLQRLLKSNGFRGADGKAADARW